jgi:hypothetical protein
MSGQPVRGPRDAEDFRKQHLATLDVMIANNEKNLQANLLHKRTGQITSQITDYRTTSQKLADSTALKIDIRRQLRRIADAPNAEQIASQLSGDDIRFLSQHIEQIVKEVQPKYRYGIDAPHFMAYFRKLVKAETEASGVPSNTIGSRQFSIETLDDIIRSLPTTEQLEALLGLVPDAIRDVLEPPIRAYYGIVARVIAINNAFMAMNLSPIKAGELTKIVKMTTKDLITNLYLNQVIIKIRDLGGDERAVTRVFADLNNEMGGQAEIEEMLGVLDSVIAEIGREGAEQEQEERRFALEQRNRARAEQLRSQGIAQRRDLAEEARQELIADRTARSGEGYEAGEFFEEREREGEVLGKLKNTRLPSGLASRIGQKRAVKEVLGRLQKKPIPGGLARRLAILRSRKAGEVLDDDELPDLDEGGGGGGYTRGKSFYSDALGEVDEGGAEESKEATEPSPSKRGRPIKQRPLPDEPLPRPDELSVKGKREYTSAKINAILLPYKKEIADAGLPTLKAYSGGARGDSSVALNYYDSIYADLEKIRAVRKAQELVVEPVKARQQAPVVDWRGQKVVLKPKRRAEEQVPQAIAWKASGEGGSSGFGGRTLDASLHSIDAPKSRTSGGDGFGRNTVQRRIRGRGLGVVSNKGLHKKVIFAPFGRFFINLVKLDDDIICFSRAGGTNIANLKTQRVSVHLANVLRKMVNGGTPSFNDLAGLSQEDKKLYSDILRKCHIPSGEGIEVPREENREDLNRFEIMKGEILSGNDSTTLIKEFKVMIIKLIHQGRLPKSEGKSLLMDLAELGY